MDARKLASQIVRDWEMQLSGARLKPLSHPHGNWVVLVALEPTATTVEIAVSGRVETLSASGVTGRHRAPMPLWFYRRHAAHGSGKILTVC